MCVYYKVSRHIKPLAPHEAEVAQMWNDRMALGSIEKRTGIPAARCCQMAKAYYRRVGGNTRPLEELLTI